MVRVAPVLLIALLAILVVVRPRGWPSDTWDAIGEWNPSSRTIRVAAAVLGALLFWFVLTRFRSGDINAIDFTVYYDRPLFQTLHGRPLFIESADDPLRAYRTHFAVHAHWILMPFSLFYAVYPSPLWLLALSVLAIVAGAISTLRIVQHIGAGGPIASASALAFVFNANTARALNYGFHVEVLYAWLIPWLMSAGIQRRWKPFLIAGLLTVAVKEDAFLLLAAAAVALLLYHGRAITRLERAILAVPVSLAIANLRIYWGYVVPNLSATGTVFYTNFWANYGPTTTSAIVGMLRRPWDVLSSTFTSGFLTTVMTPFAYLPFVGWPWLVGVVPIVLLYGASANEQLRSFGIYYAMPLVPFLTVGAADGGRRLADRFGRTRNRARVIAAAVILAGALLAGVSNAGYVLRPWAPQVSAVPRVLREISGERSVLVQSALYPHAGYDERVQLLTHDSLRDPRYAGAALLLAPGLSAYPLSGDDLAGLSGLPTVVQSPERLLVVRASAQP